jgi:cytochrome c553
MRILSLLLTLVVLSVAVTAQDSGPEAAGTVNELMIGITFPNSNIVNEAAYEDPEDTSDDSLFDTYVGWLKVEAAAVAMAESANLLSIPGRLCSNGERAPVEQEDWATWVEDLRESGKAAYEAAKAKSQDTLVELSDQLIASCVDCHARYLDVGGDPNNRCMP